MWRGGLISGGLFILIGAGWAVLDPLMAFQEVRSLSRPDGDLAPTEAAILKRGRAALPALRQGLRTEEGPARLRCARLLALLGEQEGDQVLLDALRCSPAGFDRVLAGHFLLTVWDRRRAPERLRAALPLAESLEEWLSSDQQLLDLSVMLSAHPGWVGGYVARAGFYLQKKKPRLAVRDALSALVLESRHFEAMVLLGRAYRQSGFPTHAVDCWELALRVHPGLRPELAAELAAARDAARTERERRLKERLQELPVL